MRELILQAFQKAVANKIIVWVSTNDEFLKFYDDTTGQRQCYLEYYGPGERKEPSLWPDVFKLKRHLTFINNGDEGKEGAVLAVIGLHEDYFTPTTHIKIQRSRIELGSLIFQFDAPVL